MYGMGWSWQELEATPRYVRQMCLDLLMTRRAAEAKAARAGQGGGG